MAVTLQTVTAKYAAAKQQVRTTEDILKLKLTFLGPVDAQQLSNMGYFFAKQAIDKVFIKAKPIEDVKNLQSIYLVLQSAQMAPVAKNLFPDIVVPDFRTADGLKNLQQQLEATPGYQTFLSTTWNDYQQLKKEKGVAKAAFSSLVKQQKAANTFSEETLAQYTTDKKIKKLAKKIKSD